MSLVTGLAEPTEGTVTVHGHPAGSVQALARCLNAGFDAAWARARLDDLGIPLERPAGRLSGGQQSQVALTLALAKRARVLLLDEPVASLDPLARRDVMTMLMTRVAETGTTVVFSSHVVAELERVCDHLVVISRARVQLVGEADRLIAAHARLIGPGGVPAPAGVAATLEQLYRWLTAHGYTQVITYQPASRFWVFQGIEAAICLAAALTALAVAYHLVTRRRTLATVRLENT